MKYNRAFSKFFHKLFSSPSKVYNYSLFVFFGICAIFGGASAEGQNINAIFSLFGISLLLLKALIRPRSYENENTRMVFVFVFLFLLLICIQLIPLPKFLWQNLPDRDIITKAAEITSGKLTYTPLSLNPLSTASNATLVIIPFLIILSLFESIRKIHLKLLYYFVPVIAVISATLGAMQVFTKTGFHIYEYVTPQKPIGVFSNINHQATLMLMAIPFLFAANIGLKRKPEKGLLVTIVPQLFQIVAFFFFIIILMSSGSIGAYLILIPVLFLSWYLTFGFKSLKSKREWAIALLGALLFVFAFIFLIDPSTFILSNWSGSTISRLSVLSQMQEMIGKYFWYGSGLGSFEDIYRLYEEGKDINRFYVNHAHNDFAEWVLETGLFGTMLLLSLFIWLLNKVYIVWTSERTTENTLARAACISLLVVFLHSFVDYPLRTNTILITASFCVGVILSVSSSKKG